MKKIISLIVSWLFIKSLTLNLQAFAYDPSAQPPNWTGSSYLPDQMQTFMDRTLIELATPNLVHDEDGQERDIPAGNGKTINFRQFADLPISLEPLTEGVTPDGSTLVQSSIEATVHQYGNFIVMTDMLDMTAFDNTHAEALKKLGNQAGQTLDLVTRNALQCGTNVMYAPKVSVGSETEVTSRYALDGTAKLTVDVIEQAVAQFNAMNVPTFKDGTYHAIVHPYAVYDLRRDPEWIDAHKYARPDELMNGELGQIAGVRFKKTSLAKIYNGADLASDSRTLLVNGAVSAAASYITFDGGTVAENALKGRELIIDGKHYKVDHNDASKIYVEETLPAIEDNKVIYPGEGGAGGIAVFGTLIYGQDAYGKTKISNGGLQTIVQPATDPLHQKNSVGWKATKTAKILVESYILRIEHCSSRYSKTTLAGN